MGKQKSKLLPFAIADYNELDNSLLEYAELESDITKQEADMNAELERVKQNYAIRTEEMRARRDIISTSIDSFMRMNKKDFDKTRSRELTHGKVGFRTSPPAVAQLNRKYTVATSIELIKKLFDGRFIRKKDEIDKEAILAAYKEEELTEQDIKDGKLDDQKLAAVGLKVDQDETLFFEIKWESLPQVESIKKEAV